MARLTIDGRAIDVSEGTTILVAARRLGIEIPTLCHDPRLRPVGECRLCAVDIAGKPHPATACNTLVQDGAVVATRGPSLEAFRHQLVEWMAAKVTPEAFADFPEKELHRLMREFRIRPAGPVPDPVPCDGSHPAIQVDMSQCIACRRCVRICEELQGQFVWHVLDRGGETSIVPDSGTTLGASSCVGCGACVDTCPSAALTDKRKISEHGRGRWTRTTCAYCGVGCEIEAAEAAGHVVAVRPVEDAPVSKGHLCVKGRYAFEFVQAPDRQLHPMRRIDGGWQRVSWAEALGHSARELSHILERYGPSAVGVLGSARATNEENYLAQKFARVVLGTNNVDSCARVCHTPTAAAMKAMLGTGAATNSFDDIEVARTILIVGANPTENHPIVGARIKQQVLRRAANLIVIDPRRIELASHAAIHLAPRPGTNIPLLNAIAHVIVTENLADAAFIRERLTDWDEFAKFVNSWPPERAASICGVDAELLRRAARLYARETPSMCFHGLGLTEHTQGTEGVMALVNLALLTGNIGKQGAGINPLRGQNNVQGAAHMGCDPGTLTGSIPIKDGAARFEAMWKATLPKAAGLNLLKMMDQAARGEFKALWIIGYDIFLTLADSAATRRALERLELVIVQDLFLNETAREFGHLFFPAASAFEKDGTFMNSERRVQRVRKAVDPLGDAQPDWQIICALAKTMGHRQGFSFENAESIWDEVRELWPEGKGLSYRRLERGGLQWPCASEEDPGTQILHATSFSHGPKAALRRIDYTPTPEVTNDAYPFLLSTGRNLYQFNAGTMTMRSVNAQLRPSDMVEISLADAERLGIVQGDEVRMRSRTGEATLRAHLSASVKPGELFATFHDPRVFLNRLTSSQRDRFVQTPEYKVTAVKLERCENPDADGTRVRLC